MHEIYIVWRERKVELTSHSVSWMGLYQHVYGIDEIYTNLYAATQRIEAINKIPNEYAYLETREVQTAANLVVNRINWDHKRPS